MSTSAALRLI